MKFFCENKFGIAAGATTAVIFFIMRIIMWLLFLFDIASLQPMVEGKVVKVVSKGIFAFYGEIGFPYCSEISFIGILIGTVATFCVVYLCGWLFAWFYNMLLDCKGKTTKTTKK